jgi:hypothetical protein
MNTTHKTLADVLSQLDDAQRKQLEGCLSVYGDPRQSQSIPLAALSVSYARACLDRALPHFEHFPDFVKVATELKQILAGINVTTPALGKGSSDGEAIINANDVARDAILDAIRAIRLAKPKRRDYYVGNPPHGFDSAEREHISRVESLQHVFDELTVIVESVRARLDAEETQRRIEDTPGRGPTCDCADCK